MGNSCIIPTNSIRVTADHDHDHMEKEAKHESNKTVKFASLGDDENGTGRLKPRSDHHRSLKVLRFTSGHDDINGGDCRGGIVRVRVVMTQKELKQIINEYKDLKYSSMEDMVKAFKLRGRRIHSHHVRTRDREHSNMSWMPALESIPEDQ